MSAGADGTNAARGDDAPTEPHEIDPRRAPRSPWNLHPRTWPGTFKRLFTESLDDHILQWAAALTFFAMLSLFPAMIALVSVLGLLGSAALGPLIENVSALAPGTARDLALDALRTLDRGARDAGLAFAVGLGAALWAASAYVGAFVPAANEVWDAPERRPLYRRVLARIAMTLVLLLLIALTALTVVLTGPIAERVGAVVGLGDQAVQAWSYLKWPFLIAVVMLLLTILYWTSPDVRHPGWRWVTPGSVVAVGLWMAASAGFTLFVNNFGTFNATYGSLASVVVFLVWLWLTNIAILFGAEVNAELERARAIEGGLRPPDRTPFMPPGRF